MDANQEVAKILTACFEERCARNPSYSLRAFARFVGLSPASISELMKNKRRISAKTAEKILLKLKVDTDKVESLTLSLQRPSLTRGKKRDKQYIRLSNDQFKVVADWYYFAILSLAETKDFCAQPEWIATRLNITVAQAENALTRLERLEMLTRDSENNLVATGKTFGSSNEISSDAVRYSHHQAFELASNSLERDPLDLRDFVSIFMAIDPDLLPEAKARIRSFRNELSQFLEQGNRREVYRMSVQLFPLTLKPHAESKAFA